MTGSSYNNGVSETRAYNTDNTLASISYSGAAIRNMSYSWAKSSESPNKNKTGETITGTMSGYGFSVPSSGYDAEDRLVTYNRTDGSLDQSWSLSAVGDWNSITTEGTAQARTHGPTHELTAVAGNSVSTDTKGNITLIPSAARPTSSSLALEWDFDNRMKAADVDNNGSDDVTYQFDALGRRVARTASGSTTVYVQSTLQTIADYASGAASSAPTYRYVYGSYIDEPVLRYQPTGAQSIYYHRNQQYSVTALTNSSATILERYAYSAYGTPTITNGAGTVLTSSAFNNRYTYTGREWDDSVSLYHYRARMYDPAFGRFCSKDPWGFKGGSWGLYEYVGGQPLMAIDPSGNRVRTLPPQHAPRNPPRNRPRGGRRGGPQSGTGGGEIPYYAPHPNSPRHGLVPSVVPWHAPDPFPPGYPKPGLNPGPRDPNYPGFIKECWREFDRECKSERQEIPDYPLWQPDGTPQTEIDPDIKIHEPETETGTQTPNEEKDNPDTWCKYALCGTPGFLPGQFVTHNCGLEFSAGVAIFWESDSKAIRCRGLCKYKCQSRSVDWGHPPLNGEVDQGTLTAPHHAGRCEVTRLGP